MANWWEKYDGTGAPAAASTAPVAPTATTATGAAPWWAALDIQGGNPAMAGDAGVPDFGNDRPAPIPSIDRLPEGQFFMDGSEVPRLSSNGDLAPTPTNLDVQALQQGMAGRAGPVQSSDPFLSGRVVPVPSVLQDASGLDRFGGIMGLASYNRGLPTAPVIGSAADFDARFGHGAAAQYIDRDVTPRRPTSWLREQLGATGDIGYGEGVGYLIDNPITRGLGNAAASTDAGLAYLAGKGADALGLDGVKQFTQGVIHDDLARQQALAAPRDAGIGSLATQSLANLGGQLAIGGMTGGEGAAAQGFARVGLMNAAKAAAINPATRMAGTLGVTMAGNEAARMEAEGHPVSGSQFGTMALTDTAANLVPLAGRWNLPTRVASGAIVGEGTNEASNVAAGRPIGTGAVVATAFGGALGVLPGHHNATLAEEGQALAHRVLFGNRVDFLRHATARQDLEERMAAAAQRNGGPLNPGMVKQLADTVANEHGVSVDELAQAPRNAMEAGAAAADQMLGDLRQTLDVTTASTTIDQNALAGFAPREPALPDVQPGVSRDDLVQRWNAAQTDVEKAAAAASIHAFDARARDANASDQTAPAWAAEIDNHPGLPESVRAGLRDRYTSATRALPIFDADMQQIAGSVGGRAIVAPLKGVRRAAEKVVDDYDGDTSLLKDLVRGTIEVSSHSDAQGVIDQLRAKYGEPLKQNSSLDPDQPAPFANGYRDINSAWSINGEPVEVQINLPEMLVAKEKAHPFYEQAQQIERVSQQRPLTEDEVARLADLNAKQAAIYQPAWDAAMRRVNVSRDTSSASSRNTDIDLRTSSPSTSANAPTAEAGTGNPASTYTQGLPSTNPNLEPAGKSGSEAGRIDASAMGSTSSEIVTRQAGDGDTWQQFAPDSGTLGIPRASMPQIKGKDRGAFLDFLDSKGFGHKTEDVPASSLKPTQAEFSPTKVEQFDKTDFGKGRAVMVSSDGHVLDGHHQWLAHRAAGKSIPVIRINAPIRDLLDAANDFPKVERSEGAPPSVNRAADLPIVETPLSDLSLSKDVPQFKDGADANGVVGQLGGKFDRRGTGPIQVWRRTNGKLEVISGRHRLDLARRSGEQTIPSQIYNEADGFTAADAATLDAELNIRDGQGKVADYVQFFQHPAFDGEAGRQQADARGLLARATGRRAYTVASEGTPDLIAAHRAGRITDEAAVQIAHAAPGSERLQALGMKLVQEGKPISVATNTMRAVQAMVGDKAPGQGDIFGFDDSAIREATDMARVASTKQRELGEQIAAVSGAAKRPEKARALGVNVKDPAAVQRRVDELRAERVEWDNWASNPRLMSQVRAELGLGDLPPRAEDGAASTDALPESDALVDDVTAPMFSRFNRGAGVDDMFGAARRDEPAAKARPVNNTGDMFGGPQSSDFLDAAVRARDDARNGKAGGRVDTGDGGLFDGKRPEQTSLTDAPKASRDTAQGERVTHNADQVRDAARKGWGKRFITKLERAGVLHFLTTDEAVARGLAKSADELDGVKGMYVDGKAYVIADNVHNLDDVPGIVVHEAGLHYGYDRLTTRPERLALRNRVNRAMAAGDRDVIAAWRHAADVGTPARAMHEETMAYLAENVPGHDLVTRVMDAIRRGLNRLGVPLDMLESDREAIRHAARDMLHRAANPKAAGASRVRVDIGGVQPWRASTIDGAPAFSRDGAKSARRVNDQTQTPAIGNDGGSDPANPDIRFSRDLLGADDSPAGKARRQAAIARQSALSQLAAEGYGQGAIGWTGTPNEYTGWRGGVQGALAALADKMDPVKRAEHAITEAIGHSIADDADAYRLENLMHGRTADRLDAIDRTHVNPLMKSMKQLHVSPKLLMDYLYARHAPERNARIASINPGMPDGGSGMSTELANDIMAGQADGVYSGKRITPDLLPKLQMLATRVDRIRDQTIATLENSGQITPALAASLRKQWQFYVPLRGKEGEADTGTGGSGRGVDVKGKPIKRALGRGDGNTAPPNILAEIVGDAQRAVIQAEKARVGRAVLKLAAEHPNPDIWQVEPVDLEWKFSDSTGETYLAARKPNADKDVMTVVHEGKAYHVRLVDPRIRDAMLNLGAEKGEVFVHWIGKLNRWLSAAFTRYSPAFIPINAMRDAVMGFSGLAAEHGHAVALDAAKEYFPAMRAVFRDVRHAPGDAGVPDAQKSMDDWAREFAENGGKTGIVRWERTEDTAKKLQRDFERGMGMMYNLHANPRAAASQALHTLAPLIHAIEHTNDAVENAMRLSAYVALRKRGMSIDRAAMHAKDLTVNFNRKGSVGGIINSLFLFYNASVQGVRRSVQLLGNRKIQAFLGGLMALQASQTAILASRQDEDGISDWDAIPDYVKQRALIIALPGRGHYFAMPMPYEFGFLTYAGGRMTQWGMEKAGKGGDPSSHANIINDLGSGLLQSFSPIPLDNGFNGLIPTPIRIPVQVYANKNDFNHMIYNDHPMARYKMPASASVREGTAAPYVWLANALNRAGGGDDYHRPQIMQGMLDWSPNQLQYLVDSFVGGMGTFGNRSWGAASRSLAGNYKTSKDGEVHTDWPKMLSDLPVLRRFGWNIDHGRAQSARFNDIEDNLERTRAQINDKLADGDFAGAQKAARDAGIFGDGWTVRTTQDGLPITTAKSVNGKTVRVPQLGTAPGSLAAAHKEAVQGLSVRPDGERYSQKTQLGLQDLNDQYRHAMTLPSTERERAIKQIRDQQSGLMGAFLRFYNQRKDAYDSSQKRE